MTVRQQPLHAPPILFAHRGASAHERENTLAAFGRAIELGATGIESDVWITSDGVAVLDHDGTIGTLRKRPISACRRDELPDHIPTLDQLYDLIGADVHLSLDLKDPEALDAVLLSARRVGAAARLWLCFHEWTALAEWRGRAQDVRLVDSTRLRSMERGPERRAAQLRAAGIDAVNLHQSEWTGGNVAVFHRFGRFALGWDAQFDRLIERLLHMGLDGVYSNHVDRLTESAAPYV